jgi:hypothetical protein
VKLSFTLAVFYFLRSLICCNSPFSMQRNATKMMTLFSKSSLYLYVVHFLFMLIFFFQRKNRYIYSLQNENYIVHVYFAVTFKMGIKLSLNNINASTSSKYRSLSLFLKVQNER